MIMLITIYQKIPGSLRKVNEYYWWNVPMIYHISDQDPAKAELEYKMPCPGCGRVYGRFYIRSTHQCPGTLTDRPVKTKRNKRTSSHEQQQAELATYIANQKHTVHVTDG
jgi:hypothetical protein